MLRRLALDRSTVRVFGASTLVALLAACAGGPPISSEPSRPPDLANAQACRAAEAADQFVQAEVLCQKAVLDAGPEPANPQFRSGRLYNLARIKRKLGKLAEAEALYRQSLVLEEQVSGPDSTWTGRRLVELAVSLAQQNKWDEGAVYLERALPIVGRFATTDRATTSRVIAEFGRQLRSRNKIALAERFEQRAAAIRPQ